MPVFIDHRICDKQEICDIIRVCPRNAIQYNDEGAIEVDNDRCTECLLCVKSCPYLAVKLARDADELEDMQIKARKIKLNKGQHLAKIYGVKPGRIAKAELNDSNFKRKVSSKTPTLVSFWGAHSGIIASALRRVARSYAGRLKVAHIKVADNPKTCKRYRITTTPTLVLFRRGREIGRLEGIRHKETLRVWLGMRLKAS